MGANNLPRVHAAAPWPGIELATSWSQVRRPTIAPPRHRNCESVSIFETVQDRDAVTAERW